MADYRFFDKFFIESLKLRITLSHIIRPYVSLRTSGMNKFVGLCPFHKEKTPSFSVDDQKGFYYCFGCHASGDAFTFIMQMQNLNYPKAVEMLANQLGIALPELQNINQKTLKSSYDRDFEFLQMIMYYFQELLHTDLGLQARQYINQRGISAISIEKFYLGYAPSSAIFFKAMERMKIPLTWLENMGMIKESYALFSNRLIFPIFNNKGLVCGFGGRALQEKQQPKYINSKESQVFHKSEILYRNTKKQNKKQDVFIVEGYIDVIALSAMECIAYAPLGTAISKGQLQIALSNTKQLRICFDSDSAGQAACKRMLSMLYETLTLYHRILFHELPMGFDPDSYVQQRNKQDFLHLPTYQLFEKTVQLLHPTNNDPENIASTMDHIFQLIQLIPNKSLQSVYKLLARKYEWSLIHPSKSKKSTPFFYTSDQNTVYDLQQKLRTLSVLHAFIYHPKLLKDHSFLLEQLHFDPPYDKIIEVFQVYLAKHLSSTSNQADKDFKTSDILHAIENYGLKSIIELPEEENHILSLLYPQIDRGDLDEVLHYVKDYIDSEEKSLQKYYQFE